MHGSVHTSMTIYLKLFTKKKKLNRNTILMVLWAIGGNDSVFGVILRNRINQMKQQKKRQWFFSHSSCNDDASRGKVCVYFLHISLLEIFVCNTHFNDTIVWAYIVSNNIEYIVNSMTEVMENESSKPLFISISIMESHICDDFIQYRI